MRIAATTFAFLTAALAPQLRAQEGSWLTDFEAAKAAAKKDQKIILADFTGSDWCGWCIKLKEEVFDTDAFRKWADEKAVLLELDFPKKKELPAELKEQNQKLKQQFGIRGYPTIVLLDADGKEIGRLGYQKGGPEKWIAAAEGQLAAGGESAWLTDYEAALERAKQEKKPVLADFTGSDWCGWGIKLENEGFDTAEVREWAADNGGLPGLDFPRNTELPEAQKKQNEKLRKKFDVQGFPTILFLDAKGKQIAESEYLPGGPSAWIADAEKKLGIDGKPKKKDEEKRQDD